VPGSAAYNLSYESVSPSEVNVTWQTPVVPNGVILHYSLALWNATHSLVLISNTSSLHIGHLRKYASYQLAVQAHTIAGPGNHTSEPLNITTLEDGEGWAWGLGLGLGRWGWWSWVGSSQGCLFVCFPSNVFSDVRVFRMTLLVLPWIFRKGDSDGVRPSPRHLLLSVSSLPLLC